MSVKTHGYARQSAVPKLAGTKPKLCKTCKNWFASRPREQRCDACLPANLQRRRTAKAHYAKLETSSPQNRSQRRNSTFEPTHTTTPKRRSSRTKSQVTSAVSDGGQLCRELALELAERIDHPHGRPVPMSRALKRAITLRNVNHGKQGRIDLERY